MPQHADEDGSKEKKQQAPPSGPKERFSPIEPILRWDRPDAGEAVLREATTGLAPRQAIQQWLRFAKAKGHRRVAGHRRFDTDLEKVDTLLEEEQSLFDFCRHKGFCHAAHLADLAEGPATHEGVEHRVFYSREDDPPRVTKITFPGKYGRIEHTPFLYLERLAITAELFPILDLRLEDCLKADGEYSIVTSMRAFVGPHPTLEKIDRFLWLYGFRKYSDGSSTIDYHSSMLGVIFRDCHPRNWVEIGELLLVPVDICPEVDTAHA